MMQRLETILPPGTIDVKPRKVDTIFSFLHGGEPRPGSAIKRFNIIYRNDKNLARVIGHEESLLEQLRADIALCVAEMSPTYFFVHAGVVEWDGRAIVIPGKSQSGKSRLVTELVRAGARYYSDEYAVFDKFGRILPFSRPIHYRDEDESGQIRERVIPVDQIGGVSGTKPIPVGTVLLTKYQPGMSWHPRGLSSGKAILKILKNSVSVRRKPDVVMEVLQRAVDAAKIVGSFRGEASEIVRWALK